ATALAADGHEVVGIDLSAPMLRLAEQRREALSADAAARLSFHLADMTTLDLGRDFALIVAPARVFQFMLTSAQQREALAALRSEMRYLLELLGFEVVADYGDFRGGPPAYGREQVWVLGHAKG